MLRILAWGLSISTLVGLLVISAESRQPVDSREPLLQWRFEKEQLSGDKLSPSCGNFPLTLTGNPKWEADTASFHFSGGDDMGTIVLARGDKLPLTTSDKLTLEAWVSLDNGARKGGLIGLVDDNRYGGAGFSLGYDEDRFRFGLATEGARKGDGILTWIRSRSTIPLGTWTHVVASFDGANMRLFINGSEEASSPSQQGAIILPSAPFVVAGYADDDERVPMNGAIREAALFNRVLDPAEVASRFKANEGLVHLGSTKDISRFLVAPYLQYPTTHSIGVGFETSVESSGLVEFGEQLPLNRKVQTNLGTMHHATLDGLKPSTSYFYRVTATPPGKGAIVGQLLTFKTAPLPGEAFNFAVFGDSQRNRRITGQVATRAWENRPSFLLHLGDVVDEGSDKNQWMNDLFRPCQELLGRVAMMPTIGNHERNHPFYYQYFNLPEPEFHYKFTWGDADFFAVDSNKPLVPGQGEMAWLERELAASKAKWKFCFHHHPCFSSDNDDFGDTFNGKRSTFGTEPMRRLAMLYERYGVDMVLNGHIHSYERTFPIRNNKVDDTGVVYLTSGGFGGGLENFSPTPTFFKAANRVDYHHVLFTINGNTLELRAFDKDGQLFDCWSKTK